jgi:hypothetical protein
VRPYSPSEREEIEVSQSFFNFYNRFYPNTEKFFLPPSKITGKNDFSRQNCPLPDYTIPIGLETAVQSIILSIIANRYLPLRHMPKCLLRQ